MSESTFIDEHTALFVFLVLLASCCTWCCLAHCIFIPCCTCLKRHHKLNTSNFIMGPDEPLMIQAAHRGGSMEGTENTLFAFKHAVSQGMNMLELDVHQSKDGQVVIVHDADLARMCGNEFAGRTIEQYDFEELPPI